MKGWVFLCFILACPCRLWSYELEADTLSMDGMVDTEAEIQSIGGILCGYVEEVEKLSLQVGVVPEKK